MLHASSNAAVQVQDMDWSSSSPSTVALSLSFALRVPRRKRAREESKVGPELGLQSWAGGKPEDGRYWRGRAGKKERVQGRQKEIEL